VACPFCGTINQIQPAVGATQLRAAVRQVLAEREAPARPTKPPRLDSRIPVGAALILFVALLLWGLEVSGTRRSAPAQRLLAPPSPPILKVPPKAPPTPSAPKGLGEPQALVFGTGGELYVLTQTSLFKTDRETQRVSWQTRLSTKGEGGSLVPVADRIALANPAGLFFFDAASGAPAGQYLFRSGGFKVSACAAGASQVLVETVFDGTLRFDAHTAAPAQGTAGCHRNTDIVCEKDQTCGWYTGRFANFDCRYVLQRHGHQLTFCEADGTKELFLVDHAGASIRWKALRGPGASTNPAYVSVIDGAVITGDRHLLEAFDEATGARLWAHALEGGDRAFVSDGHRLFFGAEGTVLGLDARTGAEVSRFIEQPR
jgi:outer membrane protein assembly factor BamB